MVTDGLTWAGVVDRWRGDAEFRAGFAAELAAHPAAAFAWECRPCSRPKCDVDYRHVVVEVAALAGAVADPRPFSGHFDAGEPTATFDNLGGDARLVAPAPIASGVDYAHLASFLRTAPAAQIDALWKAVGDAVSDRWSASDAPLWVSTAGLGVSWLHVRLDSRPKYYRHAPFRLAG